MSKKNLQTEKSTEEEVTSPPSDIFISFSDLYQKKQSWLEEQLCEGKRVFLISKRGLPIKLSLAEFK